MLIVFAIPHDIKNGARNGDSARKPYHKVIFELFGGGQTRIYADISVEMRSIRNRYILFWFHAIPYILAVLPVEDNVTSICCRSWFSCAEQPFKSTWLTLTYFSLQYRIPSHQMCSLSHSPFPSLVCFFFIIWYRPHLISLIFFFVANSLSLN